MAASTTEAVEQLKTNGQVEHSRKKQTRSELLSTILQKKYLEMCSLYQQVPEREALYPPLSFTVSNYHQLNTSNGHVYSPAMYTHPGGYHVKLVVWPGGVLSGHGRCVSVWIASIEEDEDVHYEGLKFPAKFTITLQLLNQHRDQDHITRDIQCDMPWEMAVIGYDDQFIPHGDLEWNAHKQTQYLKNDCLKFRITKATISID